MLHFAVLFFLCVFFSRASFREELSCWWWYGGGGGRFLDWWFELFCGASACLWGFWLAEPQRVGCVCACACSGTLSCAYYFMVGETACGLFHILYIKYAAIFKFAWYYFNWPPLLKLLLLCCCLLYMRRTCVCRIYILYYLANGVDRLTRFCFVSAFGWFIFFRGGGGVGSWSLGSTNEYVIIFCFVLVGRSVFSLLFLHLLLTDWLNCWINYSLLLYVDYFFYPQPLVGNNSSCFAHTRTLLQGGTPYQKEGHLQ